MAEKQNVQNALLLHPLRDERPGLRCSHGQISGVENWCLTLALCPALPGLDTLIIPPTLHTIGNLRHSKSMLATLLMVKCKGLDATVFLVRFPGCCSQGFCCKSLEQELNASKPHIGAVACTPAPVHTWTPVNRAVHVHARGPPPVLPARHALSRRHHLHGPRRRPAHEMRPVDPQCHDACYADLRGTHSQLTSLPSIAGHHGLLS
jgi:hypothetical protein